MRFVLLLVLAIDLCYVTADDAGLTEVPENLIQKCDVNLSGTLKGIKFTGKCDDKACEINTGGNISFQITFVSDIPADLLLIEVDVIHEITNPYNISLIITSDTVESCDNDNIKLEGGSNNCTVQPGITYTMTITKENIKMLPGPGNITMGIATVQKSNLDIDYLACLQFPFVSPKNNDDYSSPPVSGDDSSSALPNSSPLTPAPDNNPSSNDNPSSVDNPPSDGNPSSDDNSSSDDNQSSK